MITTDAVIVIMIYVIIVIMTYEVTMIMAYVVTSLGFYRYYDLWNAIQHTVYVTTNTGTIQKEIV